ncbi:M1 family aminopeptidase [Pedobacter sp. ASV12]|uniref:M1 family aminopeptidase n=1 Tax=Pedobacter sp. ASV12 TaxID=2795120 RepID=UPI0018EB5BC0|nr:M1 family aminopeptidase [Pedobacter sp. ASV12]
MMGQLLRFELKYHFGQLSFKITALLFFALGMVIVNGGFGSSEVYKNSPFTITYITSFLSLLTVFASTLCCANVVLRDQVYQMDSVVFTTSIKKRPYFFVRFAGLVVAVFFILVVAILGMLLGGYWFAADQLGPFKWVNCLQPLLVFGLPNILFSSAIIFCTAVLSKNTRAIYAAGVLLYILYMAASILGNSPMLANSAYKTTDSLAVPILTDPFGLAAFFATVKTWTDLQRNTQQFPVEGLFLMNRLLWLGFTAVLILLSYRLFNFRLGQTPKSKQAKVSKRKIALVPFRNFKTQAQGFGYSWLVFKSQFRLETVSLFKHISFMVMLLLWIFIYTIELKDTIFNGQYGTSAYPTTGLIVEQLRSMRFSLILVIFFAAELLGSERSVNIHSLIYSTPIGNWPMWAAKTLALMVLVLALTTTNIGIGIALQLSHGYFNIEPLTYISLYYYNSLPLCLFVVLIVFAQNLSANKYLGMVLGLFVAAFFVMAQRVGLEHYLFRFAAVPDLEYSYFNGFGHYAKAFNWYMVYWSGFCVLLAGLTVALWQDRLNSTLTQRFKRIGHLIRSHKWLFGLAIVVFFTSGGYIYEQTNLVGGYQNKKAQLDWRIRYEKKYKALANWPQPTVKSVKTHVDLLTKEAKYHVKGSYLLQNESKLAIAKIWVGINREVNYFDVRVRAKGKSKIDREFKQQFIELEKPLKPGDTLYMDFSLEVVTSGFVPFNKENSVVENGSYIELEKFVPDFGYNSSMETSDERARKKAGLAPIVIGNATDSNYHLIDLETTISTAPDQQVVTVGQLQKEWIKDGRRYFHYKTTQPIDFMFALSSARYQVKTELYKGMALKLYYLKGHEYNLSDMLQGMKDALSYGAEYYSPYQFKQLSLAEIPQYNGAATAYAGVLFSAEKLNFLTNYNKSLINHAYAIAAHETAHQWWANQLRPLSQPGADMFTESMAKYTEAVLMEHRYGKMYLRKYLSFDNNLYFVYSATDHEERPLGKSYNQPYIYYQKGGLVMYALKEMLGEREMNLVLSRLLAKHSSPNKRAGTEDLVAELYKAATHEQRQFIDESINKMMVYRMSLKVLQGKALANGQYELKLQVNIEPSEKAGRTALQPHMTVDLATFDQLKEDWTDQTKPFYLKKHHFTKRQTILSIMVPQKPKAVALDPYAYYLDDNQQDNLQTIK